jgi:hypothetical protein
MHLLTGVENTDFSHRNPANLITSAPQVLLQPKYLRRK